MLDLGAGGRSGLLTQSLKKGVALSTCPVALGDIGLNICGFGLR